MIYFRNTQMQNFTQKTYRVVCVFEVECQKASGCKAFWGSREYKTFWPRRGFPQYYNKKSMLNVTKWPNVLH